jgi:hypothetical protein
VENSIPGNPGTSPVAIFRLADLYHICQTMISQ